MFGGPLNIKSEEAQCNYIMLWVGEKGRQIHSTWNFTEDERKQLKGYYDGFESYCAPNSNRIFNRYKFKSRAQEDGEPFESFVTELKVLIKDCGYPEATQEEMIRDHIVFGVRNSKIREKLINEGSDLTLTNCVDIARTYELSQTQVKNITGQSVNTVRNQQPGRPSQSERSRTTKPPGTRKTQHRLPTQSRTTTVCGNCGNRHSKDNCPAKGNVCLYCKKQNHFAKRTVTTGRSMR